MHVESRFPAYVYYWIFFKWALFFNAMEFATSINYSGLITGMEIYPLRPSYLEVIPEPLLAGVLGGVCFLFVAIILSLVTACYMSQRRQRRRRKRRHGKKNQQHTISCCSNSFWCFRVHVMLWNFNCAFFDIWILLSLIVFRSPICFPEELLSRVSVLTSTPEYFLSTFLFVHLHFDL